MEAVLDEMKATEHISANLRRLLAQQDMTQSELARRAECGKMYISHVINGAFVPNVVAMARIAEALGVKVDDLIACPKRRQN